MADATAWINPAIHATAADWAARVVTNGGAAVSNNTLYAVSAFCGGLDAAAISNLMIAVNVFAPDNLTAAITPLYVLYGNDPWTNNNFVAADLSIQGLKGNASNKYLDSGVVPNTTSLTATTAGVTVYNTFPDLNNSNEFQGSNSVGANWFGIQVCNASANAVVWLEENSANGSITATALRYGLGFFSGSRTDATHASLYAANSQNPFAALGSIGTTGGAPPTFSMAVFARNNGGTIGLYSRKRLSFAAVHMGLTSSETQALFNAVQSLRQQLGGGWI